MAERSIPFSRAILLAFGDAATGIAVPANTIANETGSDKVANIVMDALTDMLRELRPLTSRQSEAFDAEKTEKRLWELQQLQRRLKRSLDSIVALGGEIEENLSFLDAGGLELKRLEKEERDAVESLRRATDSLNAARREATTRF